MHIPFWQINLKERDHYEDLITDETILGWNLQEYDSRLWSGLIRLRIEAIGRIL
jgi:hypothetical protein